MQAGPADSRNRSEYNLPTTADYYKRFTNANTFISNNANPFLISPYSPNQVNGSAVQTTFYVNTIKPLTPSGIIQIQGNVNIASGYYLSLNRNQVYTNKIYEFPPLIGGFETSVVCDGAANTIKFNMGGPFSVTPLEISSSQITASEGITINNTSGFPLALLLTVNGTISALNVESTNVTSTTISTDTVGANTVTTTDTYTNTLNMTSTTIGTAGAIAGYIPITVDSGSGPVNYKLAVYNP